MPPVRRKNKRKYLHTERERANLPFGASSIKIQIFMKFHITKPFVLLFLT